MAPNGGPDRALAPRATLVALAYGLLTSAACFDSGLRFIEPEPTPPPKPLCNVGDLRCTPTAVEICSEGADGAAWTVQDDCAEKDLVCAPVLFECKTCIPNEAFCKGQDTALCDGSGDAFSVTGTCDPSLGQACRAGGCPNLCERAREEKSNVGCEYWGVDLDNAMIDSARNAAAQQFAIVVSNPQPDVPVEVTIYQDEGIPGGAHDEVEIASAIIAPLNLRVFKLGPREVDGSPEGEYDTGTHTAVTRHGYRVASDFPVVAYQFNPLENVNVFSNDASLLKPREALTFETGLSLNYVVASWPQTIAITDDPNTNFSSSNPINLRSFLTIVATLDGTRVIVEPTTAVLGGGPVPDLMPGESFEITLDAYDVLNLETPNVNAFNADFTGTLIQSDNPIAVFAGGEASDAPNFDSLIYRRCCADHLEEQLDPVRTAGKRFALAHSPDRTPVVQAAGGELGVAPEPEFFRFVGTVPQQTVIETTLPPPDDRHTLNGNGDFREVATTHDFLATADRPIHVVQVMASQAAANVPRELPGGDPSLLVVPPIEQFRPDYVFLTPDKYAFDFVSIVAPPDASVTLDGARLDGTLCAIFPTDGLSDEERAGSVEWITYRCQLSFATVDPDTGEVMEGQQNDGVHRVVANAPVGVSVFGFDAFVSYAYAAGTELRGIAPPQ
ncbi:MAG: IgGFc-binding protein [Polyangiaceae bacterium]